MMRSVIWEMSVKMAMSFAKDFRIDIRKQRQHEFYRIFHINNQAIISAVIPVESAGILLCRLGKVVEKDKQGKK